MSTLNVGFRWQVANMTEEDFVTDGRSGRRLVFSGGRVGIRHNPIPCEVLKSGEVSDTGWANCYTDRTSGDYSIFFSPPFGGPNEQNLVVKIPVSSLTPGCLMTIVVSGTKETGYNKSNIQISHPFGKMVGSFAVKEL